MIGSVLGGDKGKLFANADVVVVPSFTENFGLVVAEALAHGVPVIAGKGTPWQRVEEIGCGLWVDNSPESLAAAIKQISKMPLREMGQRGRDWMAREYSWDLMAKRTMELYSSILSSNYI
jgi:glycosyltransferase involved in cell wall biosynthesis